MSEIQKWQLDTLFEGGSASKSFRDFLEQIKVSLVDVKKSLESSADLGDTILHWEHLGTELEEAEHYVGCLMAQDVQDSYAQQLEGELAMMHAEYTHCSDQLDRHLAEMSDHYFQHFIHFHNLTDREFRLTERRRRVKEKLNPALEKLIEDLAVDGYHGWSQLYSTLIGQVEIPVIENGQEIKLSWGQAYNRLGSADRKVRKEAFENSNRVWHEQRHSFAHVLNHIAGFRLKAYEHRGWHFLKEPFDYNRLSDKTLQTMWKVIEENKDIFCQYMQHKAKLLGIEKLSWYDLEAPLTGEKPVQALPYEAGTKFIIDHFQSFSPQMADFTRTAFEKRWIEVEDRPGKRPGGFCTNFPLKKESLIFMTYSGTRETLFTLAHEIGHAFHNHVIYSQPPLAREFPMNLAETASIFAELVVSEAALKLEKDPHNRLQLLDGKIQRAIVFFFNIHARYLFEVAFYEERKKGSLSPERLCQLMEEAQQKAYCNNLEEYHPYFWISKMHFHFTGVSFYNFPYTFGYLFSSAVYLKALKEKDFEQAYIDLLADTGKMTAEDLAKKHLQVSLDDPSFWQGIIDPLKDDVKEFLKS
jgi:oligoendopeptidase F